MRSAFFLAIAVLGGCDTEGDKAAFASHGKDAKPATPGVTAAAPAAATGSVQPASVTLSPAEDKALRRQYGPADMKYNPCVKRKDATLQGRGCSSGIILFGPYVNVPANSEVELTLDIQSPSAIGIHSDMGSQVGKRALGAIAPQPIAANEKRRIGYKINMAQPDAAVETRVWLQTDSPVDFEITNLLVTVR
jgi:hypothetical protein